MFVVLGIRHRIWCMPGNSQCAITMRKQAGFTGVTCKLPLRVQQGCYSAAGVKVEAGLEKLSE